MCSPKTPLNHLKHNKNDLKSKFSPDNAVWGISRIFDFQRVSDQPNLNYRKSDLSRNKGKLRTFGFRKNPCTRTLKPKNRVLSYSILSNAKLKIDFECRNRFKGPNLP